jgi:hypothetical protein
MAFDIWSIKNGDSTVHTAPYLGLAMALLGQSFVAEHPNSGAFQTASAAVDVAQQGMISEQARQQRQEAEAKKKKAEAGVIANSIFDPLGVSPTAKYAKQKYAEAGGTAQFDNSGMLSGAVKGGASGLASGGAYGGVIGAVLGALSGAQQTQSAGGAYDQKSNVQQPSMNGAEFVQGSLGTRGTDYYLNQGRF